MFKYVVIVIIAVIVGMHLHDAELEGESAEWRDFVMQKSEEGFEKLKEYGREWLEEDEDRAVGH